MPEEFIQKISNFRGEFQVTERKHWKA